MTGLDQAIRARLDEFCESDMCAEVGKAALLAVLDLHAAVDDGSGHQTVCGVCTDPAEGWDRIALPSPCPTVRVIAEKLGVEADGD